jgi:hypothetical protein
MTIDRVLADFADAWKAGRRPQVDAYLERVPPPEREALAEALLRFLDVAPAPAYDDAALEAVRAEPALAGLRAALASEAGALQELVPQLRARRGLDAAALAGRLAARLGLSGQEERTRDYLDRLERGELAAARLSDRLLDALAAVLQAPADALREAAAIAAPARPAAAMRFRRDPGGAGFEAELEALGAAAAVPAPAGPLDELDRLFTGGRDA